jgi:Fic family protein
MKQEIKEIANQYYKQKVNEFIETFNFNERLTIGKISEGTGIKRSTLKNVITPEEIYKHNLYKYYPIKNEIDRLKRKK